MCRCAVDLNFNRELQLLSVKALREWKFRLQLFLSPPNSYNVADGPIGESIGRRHRIRHAKVRRNQV